MAFLNQLNQNWLASRVRPEFLKSLQAVAGSLDCEACSKARTFEDPVRQQRYRDYKCCTFQPFLPNFLLGNILGGGRLALQTLEAHPHLLITPLGLCPSSLYRERRGLCDEDHRGREHLCVFYNVSSKRCGIWNHRPAECAGYFCRENEASQTLSRDLHEWELAIAQMAMMQRGFDDQDLDECLRLFNGEAKSISMSRLWRGFPRSVDRDLYFKATAAWAEQLGVEEIVSWLPSELKDRFDSWLKLF